MSKMLKVNPFINNKKIFKSDKKTDFEYSVMSMDKFQKALISHETCKAMNVIFHSAVHYEYARWINDDCIKFFCIDHGVWFKDLYESYVQYWKIKSMTEIEVILKKEEEEKREKK
jgi:hypothetical protein